MWVGTPNLPSNVKTTWPTQPDHVVTKEFVFPDKANPFFFSLQLFLWGPQHPRTKLLISSGGSFLLWRVGVWCESPYSSSPRSSSTWAPELSEHLPSGSIPGAPTQLPLPGTAATTPAASATSSGQAWAQGSLRSGVRTTNQRESRCEIEPFKTDTFIQIHWRFSCSNVAGQEGEGDW